jgi:hypothetical protein
MAERQAHGFIYEDKTIESYGYTDWKTYIKKYPNTDTDGIYTSTWDAINESEEGKYYKGKPVQIKTIQKNGSVDLGDIFRNANKKEDFTLIVGFWEGSKTNIVEEYVIEVDYKKWNKELEWDKYEELRDWIKNKVSNDYDYDDQWKEECKYYKNDWGRNRLIQPRFKRDHKTQRRIQCGITYKKFIQYIVKEGNVSV